MFNKHPSQHFPRRIGPVQVAAFLAVILAGLSLAFGAETKGKVIATKDLPPSITSKAKSTANKFPGIPACSMGRMLTDMSTVMDLDDSRPDWWKSHKCYNKPEVYVCTAFGKLSVRCE